MNIKEIDNFLAGLPKIKFDDADVDKAKAVHIYQSTYGITSARSKYPIIGVSGVLTCIGGIGFCDDVTFSFHADAANIRSSKKTGNLFIPILEDIDPKGDKLFEIALFGGLLDPRLTATGSKMPTFIYPVVGELLSYRNIKITSATFMDLITTSAFCDSRSRKFMRGKNIINPDIEIFTPDLPDSEEYEKSALPKSFDGRQEQYLLSTERYARDRSTIKRT